MCQIHRKLNAESMNMQFLLYNTHGMKERIVRVGRLVLVVVYHHGLNAGSSSQARGPGSLTVCIYLFFLFHCDC